MPIFGNAIGFWALLAVPALLAIHFLQQRARLARTSTWFLIEKLAPDSARGRTWDRLRTSRTLWLQLLAALLATWVLVEPRWLRAESAQTVVVVLDASASLSAFRGPATAAAEREMSAANGLAVHTTWVVMTTNPRQPPLYRGPEENAARAALRRWQPELGRHDPAPALRLARGLAGAAGRTLFITDSRGSVPPAQRAVGVGQPLENVGFAGATISREGEGLAWRALLKNHSDTPQRRTWQVAVAGRETAPQSIALAPAALVEISGALPADAAQATVVLSADAFADDDRLPIMRPAAKPLRVAIAGEDEAADFFRRVAAAVDGVTDARGGEAMLRLARASADEIARESRGGIFWAPADQRAQAPLLHEPVTAERHPLVSDLNWQGWFGTGAHGYVAAPGDEKLLWHGRWPVVFVRSPRPGARQLLLAFDWATSNAARLPATVLLARRFLEQERDAQRAPYAGNFDCAAPVAIAGWPLDGREAFTWEFQPADGSPVETRSLAPAEVAGLRAPGARGIFRRAARCGSRGAGRGPVCRSAARRFSRRLELHPRARRGARGSGRAQHARGSLRRGVAHRDGGGGARELVGAAMKEFNLELARA